MVRRAIVSPLHRRLLLVVAAALLPLITLSAVGVVLLERRSRADARASTIETMRAMVGAVDGELQRALAALETLAESRQLDERDFADFYDDAQRVLAKRPGWITISLADRDGRQILNLLEPLGTSLPAHRELDSVREAVETQRPTVGRYATSSVHERAGFSLRVPVVRDGTAFYVLSALLEPGVMLEVIERQRVPPDGVVSIFDATGHHVARSRRHEEYLGQRGSETLRRMMAGRMEGWGRSVTLEGQEIYAAFSRSNRTGWSVAVGTPAESIDATIRESFGALVSGVVLSLGVGALASYLLARRITGPIAELRAAAIAVGRGEVPRAPETSIAEVGEVARALVGAARARQQAEAMREELLQREREAREAAEKANRGKDEFLAMLSHELRNPIAAIANASHLVGHLESGSPATTEARARALQVITRQVRLLARMVDDLLDVARLITGKVVLDRRPLDLAEVVKRALATLSSAGALGQHRLETRLQSVWVHADEMRLEQIITNLVVNAVKYTPPGAGIGIVTEHEGQAAVLRVRDEGIGIPDSLLPRIFDLFEQGERDLARSQGGLGIGLTLVRRLVELHDGTIAAASDGAGRGSEFSVRFPASERAGSAERAPGGPQRAVRRPRRVLVIEDNRDAREMLEAVLRTDGHTVDSAEDGRRGLELATAHPPEVALVDIGLPDMDGYAVARALRAMFEPRAVRLIALSGYGSPADRRRSAQAGFDRHLVKPVDPTRLLSVLAEVPDDANRFAGSDSGPWIH